MGQRASNTTDVIFEDVKLGKPHPDLFIIALRGGSTLAQAVRTWLSRSLTLRDTDRAGALVVLLSDANAQSGANAELLA